MPRKEPAPESQLVHEAEDSLHRRSAMERLRKLTDRLLEAVSDEEGRARPAADGLTEASSK